MSSIIGQPMLNPSRVEAYGQWAEKIRPHFPESGTAAWKDDTATSVIFFKLPILGMTSEQLFRAHELMPNGSQVNLYGKPLPPFGPPEISLQVSYPELVPGNSFKTQDVMRRFRGGAPNLTPVFLMRPGRDTVHEVIFNHQFEDLFSVWWEVG